MRNSRAQSYFKPQNREYEEPSQTVTLRVRALSIKPRDYYIELGKDLLEREYKKKIDELNALKRSLLEQVKSELNRETGRLVSALQSKVRA